MKIVSFLSNCLIKIPAFAGMTVKEECHTARKKCHSELDSESKKRAIASTTSYYQAVEIPIFTGMTVREECHSELLSESKEKAIASATSYHQAVEIPVFMGMTKWCHFKQILKPKTITSHSREGGNLKKIVQRFFKAKTFGLRVSKFKTVLFILLSLISLQAIYANSALPPLIKDGEKMEFSRERYYIDNSTTYSSVAYSPDGKRIISGSGDKTVKVWDAKSFKLIAILKGHQKSVLSAAYSSDGKRIISGSSDNTIKVWDAKSFKLIVTLKGHQNWILSVAYSPDGKNIISASRDSTIKIWDAKSFKLIKTVKGHQDWVCSVAYSPDGKTIISSSVDNTIKIWDAKSFKLIATLKGHQYIVLSVAYSPDGKNIISGSGDKTVKVWDAKSFKLIATLKGHLNWVYSVAYSPDGKTIISGSRDKTVKVWDANSFKLIATLKGHQDSVFSVAYSPDDKNIISGSWDRTINVWDSNSFKEIARFVIIENSNWASFDYNNNKLYRTAKKDFIYIKNGNKLTPLLPPDMAKKDSAKIVFKDKNITIESGKERAVDLEIENLLDKRIYWLNTVYQDSLCVVPYANLDVIDPNAKGVLRLKVFAKLDRFNPKPIEKHNIELKLTTANGSKFSIDIPVSIKFANLKVDKAILEKDILSVDIKNIGNSKLTEAKVELLEPFKSQLQGIDGIDINSSETISFVVPQNVKIDSDSNLTLKVYLPNKEELKSMPEGSVAPLYEWGLNGKIDIKRGLLFLLLLVGVALIVLAILIWYYKRYRDPLVLKLSSNPKDLLSLEPSLLKEAYKKLDAIGRFDTILKQNSIKKDAFKRALEFFDVKESKKVEILKDVLGAKIEKAGDIYEMDLGDGFKIVRLQKLVLKFCRDKESIEKVKEINDKVLVISSSEEQNDIAKIARDKSNRLIAPTNIELVNILLSSSAEDSFIEVLSECLLFQDVSPYQTNSDIKSEANFFGRVEILREIISNSELNYLIVGARQLGKSSILRAVERRYKSSSNLKAIYLTLDESGDLAPLAKELKCKNSLEDIVESIKNSDKKILFLIDEADSFMKLEKERGYLTTSVFRQLSQDGYANFIFVGFWTLYRYVALDYYSPLKNFGKVITLGGLEKEACRDLMIEPMRRIGIEYESEEIVEETIELCGYRANYIAIVCDEILKVIDGNIITKESVERALQSDSVNAMLSGWGEFGESLLEERVDKLVVLLNITKDSFRLKDIVNEFKELGLNIDIDIIQKSLDRLVLGYIIKREKGNYYFRVPLLKRRILEDDIDILIDELVISLKAM